MLDKDGIALLSKLCEMTEGEKYSVYDWTDVFDGGLDDERKNVWRTLLQQGCVSVKYSDESSVCFAVTLKGRNINEELATMQVVGDENQTVVRTDAAGRPVMVVKDGQSFVDNLRKKLHSRSLGFIWSIIGGVIGGIIGGGIVALIMHFAIH